MASPLQPAKQSVNLAGKVPGSRIRRDPPPPQKVLTVRDVDERNKRMVMIGVGLFALAIFVVTIGVSYAMRWSPKDHTMHLYL